MNTREEFEAWAKEHGSFLSYHEQFAAYAAANERQQERINRLREALEKWLGPADDPNAGWHGSGGTHEVYACEYCNAKHGDCTQIPHRESCPIPAARAALRETQEDA